MFFRNRNMVFHNFPAKKNEIYEFDLKIKKTKNLFDSPIFCIFVLLFFSRYFINTQINNRLSADRDFALVWTENKSNVI